MVNGWIACPTERRHVNYRTTQAPPIGVVIEVTPVMRHKSGTNWQAWLRHHRRCPLCDPIDRQAPRTLLHAHRLTLPSGQSFEADTPPDIRRYLDKDVLGIRRALAQVNTQMPIE